MEPKIHSLVLGNNIRLLCHPDSNLAQVNWNFAGKPLPYSNRKYTIYNDSILIYNASAADAGRYTCTSVERAKGKDYTQMLAIYDLREQSAVVVTDRSRSHWESFLKATRHHQVCINPKSLHGIQKLLAVRVNG